MILNNLNRFTLYVNEGIKELVRIVKKPSITNKLDKKEIDLQLKNILELNKIDLFNLNTSVEKLFKEKDYFNLIRFKELNINNFISELKNIGLKEESFILLFNKTFKNNIKIINMHQSFTIFDTQKMKSFLLFYFLVENIEKLTTIDNNAWKHIKITTMLAFNISIKYNLSNIYEKFLVHMFHDISTLYLYIYILMIFIIMYMI